MLKVHIRTPKYENFHNSYLDRDKNDTDFIKIDFITITIFSDVLTKSSRCHYGWFSQIMLRPDYNVFKTL